MLPESEFPEIPQDRVPWRSERSPDRLKYGALLTSLQINGPARLVPCYNQDPRSVAAILSVTATRLGFKIETCRIQRKLPDAKDISWWIAIRRLP